AYRNDIIPRSRGDAVRIRQEAEAYQAEIVARSQGDADRFTAVYKAFKVAQDATVQRLYLETMEEILKNRNKIISDNAAAAQLGEVRAVRDKPGLWFKRPFVENVIYYDNRVLDFEPPHEEVIVSDQKRLVTDTYTRYRITNPLLFYQTVGSEAGVRARLSALVTGSLRRVLGSVTLNDILSEK